jgi:hypothetical protein
MGRTRFQRQRLLQTGTQVESGGTASGVSRQLVTQALVEDLDVELLHEKPEMRRLLSAVIIIKLEIYSFIHKT